jgi:hypothetical protein
VPILVSSYEDAVYFDVPVWRRSGVIPENAFALFDTLRELAFLVKLSKVPESLVIVGKCSRGISRGCVFADEESNDWEM